MSRHGQPAPAICAIVVTYNPEPGLDARIQAVLPQVANLVIIDNSESAAAIFYAETANALQVMVVANGGNRRSRPRAQPGSALGKATHPHHTHVLLLIEDSTVNPDMVSVMPKAREAVGVAALLSAQTL